MASHDAPMKTLNEGALAAGGRRFRFVPLRDRLRAASARPAALPPLPPPSSAAATDTAFSHFADALAARRELDLTADFSAYADRVAPLALSLPLVFTARTRIVRATLAALAPGTPAVHSLTDCLCALARDLGPDHFSPFLPGVVRALACLFGDPGAATGATPVHSAAAAAAAAAAQLWDPERSLVPAFAAFARIVKLLVQPLVRGPDAAVCALAPLLAHAHYRVREMAAEASAGYLLRKTRDRAALLAMCDACLRLPAVAPAEAELAAVDGVAAVLYEGTRAIRGGLHPLAVELISHALERTSACDPGDPRFVAVTNALAALRQNTADADAVADLSAAILARVEQAIAGGGTGDGANAVSNAVFLLRRWCAHRSGARMREAHQQRALDLAVSVASPSAASGDRATCEALGVISAVLDAQPLGAPRYRAMSKAARACLVAAAGGVSTDLAPVALQTLRAAFEARAVSLADILDTYAALCDRVVDGEEHAALEHALLFLRTVRSRGSSTLTPLKAPRLCAHVNAHLDRAARDAASSEKALLALEFCRLAVAEGSCDPLHRIVDRWAPGVDGSSAELVSLSLNALVAQRGYALEDCAALIPTAVRMVVDLPGQLAAVRALSGLLSRHALSLSDAEVDELVAATACNLSSSVRQVRCQAAFLLTQIQPTDSGASSKQRADDAGEEQDGEDSEGALADLFVRMESGVDAAPLFDAVRRLTAAPLTVEHAASTQQLILALAGLPRRKALVAQSPSTRTVLAHAAVGLFRTKFKMLWKGAGELWCAVALEDPQLAWVPLREALLSSKSSILRSNARRASQVEVEWGEGGEGGDDGEADDADEAVAGDGEDEGGEAGAATCGSKRKQSSAAVAPVDESDDEDDTEDRSGKLPPLPKRARRAQAKGLISLRWSSSSWLQDVRDAKAGAVSHAVASVLRGDVAADATDATTLHHELLVAIGSMPATAFAERPFIIRELFLALNPDALPRRLANSLVRTYAELLEKLGGLKGAGDDKVLEQDMRARLLQDLCRPESSCQAAVIKCLAASRSPEIMSVRPALLRLVADSTFRDELTVLATKLREEGRLAGSAASAEDDALQDVLVRICFGKMRGRRARLGSRRGAVLAFVVSTLTWSDAIPRLIRLCIAPIGRQVSLFLRRLDAASGAAEVESDDIGPLVGFPPMNVLRGILQSMEAIVQQFGMAIPDASWRRLVGALFLMLQATSLVSAKTVRALTLRRLAVMVDKRPRDTEFISSRVVAAVRSGRFDASTAADVTDAPGLLVFLAACARSPLPDLHARLIRDEAWAFTWSLGVVSGVRARARAVELAMEVAQLVVKHVSASVTESAADTVGGDLQSLLPRALRDRLSMFQDLMAREGKLGPWRPVLEQTMALVAVLGDCGLGDGEAKTLVDALASFVVADAGRCADAVRATLLAMGGLFAHICRAPSEPLTPAAQKEADEFVSRHALSLTRMLNDKPIASQPEEREALCRALRSLGRPDLVVASGTLSKMGAMRRDRVDEADYDARLGSLSCICKATLAAVDTGGDVCLRQGAGGDVDGPEVPMQTEALCALMRGCLWALKDDDSAARGTAGYALALLSKWAASAVAAGRGSEFADEFLPALATVAVQAPDISERREACGALGELVRSSMAAAGAKGPSPLLEGLQRLARPDNADLDFFENVAHLQPHRRSRALRRLSALLDPGAKPASADEDKVTAEPPSAAALRELATEFAMPLAYRVALDVSEATDRKAKHAKSMETRDAVRADVGIWASEACGAAAGHLCPRDYRIVLTRVLRRLPREDSEARLHALYALLVSIADAFPLDGDDGEPNEEMAEYLSKTALPQMLKHVTAGAIEGDVLTSVVAGHTKRGQGGIGSSGAGARNGMLFRAPVAVAAARLMTRMKSEEMETTLPLLITPVANALRSRMNDVREGAKKALVRLVVMLGAKYLPYVVQQVLQVLERGFRKDAGVYVLHALLMGIQAARKQEREERRRGGPPADAADVHLPVDAAAGIIADALAAELVESMPANAKDFDNPNVSSSRARDAANRATRAADAAELLGELIVFQTSVRRVTKSFRDVVVSASSSKLAARLEASLQRLALGLVRNPSLSAADALRFAHEMMHDHMPLPLSLQAGGEAGDGVACRQYSMLPRGHVMVEFGILFLNASLSKSVVRADGSDAAALEMRAMLGPFLPEVAIALKSRFDTLTLAALKVTQRLVRLPLTGRASVAGDMTSTVLHVLSRRGVGRAEGHASSNSCQDLFQTCLRAASAIVHEVGKGGGGGGGGDTIREETMRQLLIISRECLDEGSVEMRNAALAFIRSVVSAQFKTPEIYDAVDDVSKLAVRGQSTGLQASCIAISVSFLVNYPLSARRIRQQLEFYVRNLSYQHPDGRLAALRAIATVVAKFPGPSVNAECEFLFLPLAAVLANDEELKCRQAAAETVKALFERVSDGRKIADMLGMAMTLLGVKLDDEAVLGYRVASGGDSALQRAGAAAVGAAVGSGSLSKPQIRCVLLGGLALGREGCQPGSEQDWSVTHAGLCGAEQAFEALAGLPDGGRAEVALDLEPLWNGLPTMLQHEHPWVRLVVCRLLGRHFAALGDECVPAGGDDGAFSLFAGPRGSVRDVIKSLCLVIEGPSLSEALAEQALKNLLYMGNAVRLRPSVGDSGLSAGGDSDGRSDDGADGDDGVGDACRATEANRGLYWLLRRVSGMATRVGQSDSALLRRACAVRFLAAAVASWGVDVVKPYLRLFIGPALRALDSKAALLSCGGPARSTAAASASAIVAMAEAMQAMLVKELGADKYYAVYNELRTRRRAEQSERKRKFAVEAAADPERAAKKRIKRSAAKSKARRRKAGEGRGRGSAWRVAHASYAVEERGANPLRDD